MIKPLGTVCTFLNGGTPSRSVSRFFEGDIPWITGADIDGPRVDRARSFITEDAIRQSATNRVPAGTILLVTRTSVGKVAIAGMPLCFSQDITAITPDPEKLDAGYLVHFLRTKQSHLERAARGATIKGVTRDVVSDLRIPLVPLPEQRRIAEILDKADALRASRRAMLARLEALTQAIFLEMFGDPVVNPLNWPRVPFSRLLDAIDSGWSPKCLDHPASEGEWGVLKLGAVTWCEYDPSENKALPPEVEPDPALQVQPGDLLFTRKNTYELVAACALVRSTPPKLLLPDLIFRLRLRPDALMDATFLQQLLVFPSKRREVQRLAGGSAGSMPNISKGRLELSLIEVPPIDLQRKFAAIVARIEESRAASRISLEYLDRLFASLQARAFQGQL